MAKHLIPGMKDTSNGIFAYPVAIHRGAILPLIREVSFLRHVLSRRRWRRKYGLLCPSTQIGFCYSRSRLTIRLTLTAAVFCNGGVQEINEFRERVRERKRENEPNWVTPGKRYDGEIAILIWELNRIKNSASYLSAITYRRVLL